MPADAAGAEHAAAHLHRVAFRLGDGSVIDRGKGGRHGIERVEVGACASGARRLDADYRRPHVVRLRRPLQEGMMAGIPILDEFDDITAFMGLPEHERSAALRVSLAARDLSHWRPAGPR